MKKEEIIEKIDTLIRNKTERNSISPNDVAECLSCLAELEDETDLSELFVIMGASRTLPETERGELKIAFCTQGGDYHDANDNEFSLEAGEKAIIYYNGKEWNKFTYSTLAHNWNKDDKDVGVSQKALKLLADRVAAIGDIDVDSLVTHEDLDNRNFVTPETLTGTINDTLTDRRVLTADDLVVTPGEGTSAQTLNIVTQKTLDDAIAGVNETLESFNIAHKQSEDEIRETLNGHGEGLVNLANGLKNKADNEAIKNLQDADAQALTTLRGEISDTADTLREERGGLLNKMTDAIDKNSENVAAISQSLDGFVVKDTNANTKNTLSVVDFLDAKGTEDGTSRKVIRIYDEKENTDYKLSFSNLKKSIQTFVDSSIQLELKKLGTTPSTGTSTSAPKVKRSFVKIEEDGKTNILDGRHTEFFISTNFIVGSTAVFLNGTRLFLDMNYHEIGTNGIQLLEEPLPNVKNDDVLIVEFNVVAS